MRRPWALPLTPLYRAGAALRWAGLDRIGARPKRLSFPVVSVGNLSVGGAGKTPLVLALAQLMAEAGIQVDVLSRGHGRQGRDAARVDAAGSAKEFGDEPLLLARAGLAVYVAAKRYEAGVLAEAAAGDAGSPIASGAGLAPDSAEDDGFALNRRGGLAGVHLLDDGFQHRQLFRDMDLVLVNSEDLADRVLPAGNLREPVSALRRASAFAVEVGDDAASERLRQLGLQQPVWRFRREMELGEALLRLRRPVVAFCGIARPERFFSGLERGGVTVAERMVFRDHHRFGQRDVARLRETVRRTGAAGLATTQKDLVRFGDDAFAGLGAPVFGVSLRVEFEDPAGVLGWLRERLPGGIVEL